MIQDSSCDKWALQKWAEGLRLGVGLGPRPKSGLSLVQEGRPAFLDASRTILTVFVLKGGREAPLLRPRESLRLGEGLSDRTLALGLLNLALSQGCGLVRCLGSS